MLSIVSILPHISFPAGVLVISRGSREHRDYWVESICWYSWLYLPPFWKRSSTAKIFVDYCSWNIADLVTHIVMQGNFTLFPSSYSCLINVAIWPNSNCWVYIEHNVWGWLTPGECKLETTFQTSGGWGACQRDCLTVQDSFQLSSRQIEFIGWFDDWLT